MRPLIIATALALAAPATALADGGGGLTGSWGGVGASAPGAEMTYIALPTENRTLIQAVKRDGGAVGRWRHLPGRYGVPQVAYDGSMTGLSADGKTLVLSNIPNRYPPRTTRLLVLSASTFKTRATITLRGHASVDAISPDGRWIYLTRYTNPRRDITEYEVVGYDWKRGGAPTKIVDPAEPDEQMGGIPFSRAVSADGRWAYTLYQADEPFIHALDTAGRTAKCIDLPQLAGKDLSSTRLKLEGNTLSVGTLARIDTRTYAPPKPQARVTAPKPARDDGGSPWPYVLAGLAVLALLALVVRRLATTGGSATVRA